MRQRRAILVGFGVAMAVITLGATAYACTVTVGKVTIDNGGGTAGGSGTSYAIAGPVTAGKPTGYCDVQDTYTNIVSSPNIPVMAIKVVASTCSTATSVTRTGANGTTVSGLTLLSSSTANFTHGDLGATLSSNVTNQIPLGTTISEVLSTTQVIMSAPAGATSTGGTITIVTLTANKFPAGDAIVTITSGGRTGDCMFNPPDPQGSGVIGKIAIDGAGTGTVILNVNEFPSTGVLPGTYSVCVTGGPPVVGGLVPGNGYVNQVLIRAGVI